MTLPTVAARDGRSEKHRLGERELALFRALNRWGVLGLGQVEGLLFWEGCELKERVNLFFNQYGRDAFDRYAYKRLRRLEKSGLVKSGRRWGGMTFWLSRSGKAAVDPDSAEAKIPFRRSWSGNAVAPYFWANRVGLTISAILGYRVRSYHQIVAEARSEGWSIADIRTGSPHLWVGRKAIPVFVEPGGYSFREPEKWKRFNAFERLVYVVGDRMKDYLLEDAHRRLAREVYAVGFTEFRDRLGQASLVNYEGRAMSLAEALGPA